MLVFPQWRPAATGDGCRVPRWMPAERFAPYFARTVVLPPGPPQIDDDDSSGGSSSERNSDCLGEGVDVNVCGWRGCGTRYHSVARLSAHVARVHAHAHSDGLFYCNWKGCSRPQRGFNARYKMLVHIRTHTNERPHTCNQCNKSFSRAENLKIHLRSHSGEKPYVCPYEGCGKAYSNSSDRFKHTRTHTVDKPYVCKVPGCNKRYTDPSSLRKHVKTYKHFVEKKNESSEEGRSFEAYSPLRESIPSYTTLNSNSPIRVTYDNALSPTIPPYNPVLPLTETSIPIYPSLKQVSYAPLEPLYPLRVPTHEMSYIEYSQMYEHAYRNYYSHGTYPVLRSSFNDKVYNYEERIDDVRIEVTKDLVVPEYSSAEEEMPLNLICTKKPIDDLVILRDLPLDLSTKS